MNKILFPLLLLAGMWASFPLAAQQLTINGTVHIEGESAENATLEILKNGQIIERKTMTKRGNFHLRFAFGADYRLTFRKEGYVHKIVTINTLKSSNATAPLPAVTWHTTTQDSPTSASENTRMPSGT